jgi:hypothetical protein
MILLECPFLKEAVRLSSEREGHILRRHDDFGPLLQQYLSEVLSQPDRIIWSRDDERILLFSRWYPALLDGKFVVVAVVLDPTGRNQPWIITAYVARKPRAGVLAWRRS